MAKQRVPVKQIARSVLILPGQRVILDSDLALIYGVSTGRLNEAVKRNIERFPPARASGRVLRERRRWICGGEGRRGFPGHSRCACGR
jgi:ORF6N domain